MGKRTPRAAAVSAIAPAPVWVAGSILGGAAGTPFVVKATNSWYSDPTVLKPVLDATEQGVHARVDPALRPHRLRGLPGRLQQSAARPRGGALRRQPTLGALVFWTQEAQARGIAPVRAPRVPRDRVVVVQEGCSLARALRGVARLRDGAQPRDLPAEPERRGHGRGPDADGRRGALLSLTQN